MKGHIPLCIFAITCMFVHFHLSTCYLDVCYKKIRVLAHNYYVMLMTKEIPVNSAFAVRPKSESSCLEVKEKLDIQY